MMMAATQPVEVHLSHPGRDLRDDSSLSRSCKCLANSTTNRSFKIVCYFSINQLILSALTALFEIFRFSWGNLTEKKRGKPELHTGRYHEPLAAPPVTPAACTSASFQGLGGYSIATKPPRAPPGLKWWHRVIMAPLNTWSNEPISPIDTRGGLRGGAGTTYVLLNQNR